MKFGQTVESLAGLSASGLKTPESSFQRACRTCRCKSTARLGKQLQD